MEVNYFYVTFHGGKLDKKTMYLFKLLTNLLVGWKRWRRLLDTECFLPCGGALHCSVWTRRRKEEDLFVP